VSSTTQTRRGRRHRRTGGCWAEKGPVLAGIKHWELGGFGDAFYHQVVHRGDAAGSIRGARGRPSAREPASLRWFDGLMASACLCYFVAKSAHSSTWMWHDKQTHPRGEVGFETDDAQTATDGTSRLAIGDYWSQESQRASPCAPLPRQRPSDLSTPVCPGCPAVGS
jgi:hypothetical protein